MLANIVRKKLTERFQPTFLKVLDESASHRGHAGVKGSSSSETHFAVEICSELFRGLSKLESHKLIYSTLSSELEDGGLHALRISCKV